MKTVAICGNMRFENEMKRIAFILKTKHIMSLLQCGYSEEKVELSSKEIEFLNKAHYRKIELVDAIYVVDINGYIGEQVKKEIAFAKDAEKK